MVTKRLTPVNQEVKIRIDNEVPLSPRMAQKILDASQFFQYEQDRAKIVETDGGVVFIFNEELIARLFERMAKKILGKKESLLHRIEEGGSL